MITNQYLLTRLYSYGRWYGCSFSTSTQDQYLQVKEKKNFFFCFFFFKTHWLLNNRVPNAIRGRDNLDIEIFGMEGIPEQDMIEHELRIQASHQSGNKKPKATGSGHYGELSLEQLQQQMAAHKAGTATTLSPTANSATLTTTATAVAGSAVTYPPLPTPAASTPQSQYYAYGFNSASGVGGGGGVYGAFNNAYYPPPPPPPPPQQQQQQQQYPIAQANFGYHASPAG